MTLEPYSLIELLTNQYQNQGVNTGAIGTILECPAPDLANNWQFAELWIDPTDRSSANISPMAFIQTTGDKLCRCLKLRHE
jgi:hypothetical protein